MAKPPARQLSLPRLLAVLAVLALLTALGTRYVMGVVANFRLSAAGTWFAPYVDVTLTPLFHFEDPTEQPAERVVLGFIVAAGDDPCQPSWGTYYDLPAAARALDLDRRIQQLRDRRGDVIVSFGGAINSELAVVCDDVAALTAAYQSVIDRYALTMLDFDIEGAAIGDRAANARRGEAIVRLQAANPALEVWFTLPVLPSGMLGDAVALLDDTLQTGVVLGGVNLMTMNFGGTRAAGDSMADATAQALAASAQQLADLYAQRGTPIDEAAIWQRLGATPMIGQNDLAEDRFTIADANALIEVARARDLGRLSFWSSNRDSACGAGSSVSGVSNTCSGVPQQPQQFARLFVAGTRRLNTARLTTNGLPLFTLPGAPATPNAAAGTPAAALRDDPLTDPYPLWRAARAYTGGEKVVWQGRVYQAKWWTQGDQPDTPVQNEWDTPWRYLGPVLPSDRVAMEQVNRVRGEWLPWSAEQVYVGGEQVLYGNQVFEARWWTQGTIPLEFPDQVFDHPWAYVGDLDCSGDSCVSDAYAATLAVDYGSLTNVTVEIRLDDDKVGTAGRLVQALNGQSGQKSYRVLQGRYDLVLIKAGIEITIDGIDCRADSCTSGPLVNTLSVDYEGLSDIILDIRASDGINGTAGGLVESFDLQSGQRTYSVVRGVYDLVFYAGSAERVVDNVDCRAGGCAVNDLGAVLTVEYGVLSDVTIQMRDNDGISGMAGALVQEYDHQRGRKSYNVLRGMYDLAFVRGGAELVLDDIDCTATRCAVAGLVADLTVTYPADATDATLELRADDGRPGVSGEPIVRYEQQTGSQRYALLRGLYDIVVITDGRSTVHDAVDCTGSRCQIGTR